MDLHHSNDAGGAQPAKLDRVDVTSDTSSGHSKDASQPVTILEPSATISTSPGSLAETQVLLDHLYLNDNIMPPPANTRVNSSSFTKPPLHLSTRQPSFNLYDDVLPLPSPMIDKSDDGIFRAFSGFHSPPSTQSLSRASSFRQYLMSDTRNSSTKPEQLLRPAVLDSLTAESSRSVSEYKPVSTQSHFYNTHVGASSPLTSPSFNPDGISPTLSTSPMSPIVPISRTHSPVRLPPENIEIKKRSSRYNTPSESPARSASIDSPQPEVMHRERTATPQSTTPTLEHMAATKLESRVEAEKPQSPLGLASTFIQKSTDSQSTDSDAIFTAYDLKMRKQTWREIRTIGRGAFSRVILASPVISRVKPDFKAKAEHLLVAVKQVQMGPLGGASRERIEAGLQREIEILNSTHHPSLIQLFAFNINSARTIMVLPYCPGGDLFDLVSSHRASLSSSLIRRLFSELARAVLYLHDQHIVHRDLKLENVLVNIPLTDILSLIPDPLTYPQPLVTLTDLGLARKIDPENPMLTTRCGSVDYVPPELLMGQPYDGRLSDAWALGVILYAMIESRLPFDPPNSKHGGGRVRGTTAHRIAKVEWSWLAYELSTEFADARVIANSLLQKRDKRWSVATVVESPWIRNVAENLQSKPNSVQDIFED